jgi:hypothetical protein
MGCFRLKYTRISGLKKGTELKDGPLFVIFRQAIKGFVLEQADEACDSGDSGAHRPRKNFSR